MTLKIYHNPRCSKSRQALASQWATDTRWDGVRRDYVVAGNYAGFRIFDVTNPADPQLMSDTPCGGSQGDITMVGYLIFRSSDGSHNRSVLTIVGDREPLKAATLAIVVEAVVRIGRRVLKNRTMVAIDTPPFYGAPVWPVVSVAVIVRSYSPAAAVGGTAISSSALAPSSGADVIAWMTKPPPRACSSTWRPSWTASPRAMRGI